MDLLTYAHQVYREDATAMSVEPPLALYQLRRTEAFGANGSVAAFPGFWLAPCPLVKPGLVSARCRTGRTPHRRLLKRRWPVPKSWFTASNMDGTKNKHSPCRAGAAICPSIRPFLVLNAENHDFDIPALSSSPVWSNFTDGRAGYLDAQQETKIGSIYLRFLVLLVNFLKSKDIRPDLHSQ